MEIEKTVIMQIARERNVDWVLISDTPKKEKNPRSSRNAHLQNTSFSDNVCSTNNMLAILFAKVYCIFCFQHNSLRTI